MSVTLISFAFLTEIKVWADTAFVSDSLDWACLASVAGYIGMDLCLLVCCLFTQVVNHESLECLGSVGLNLISHDLDYFIEELVVEVT